MNGTLLPGWELGAGYAFSQVKYVKDSDPANDNQRFSSDTPERLFKLTTRYNFQGPLEKLRVGGNVYWQSRMYNDIALANGGSYRLEQGGYAVTDLMAGYEVNKHLDLQVNANNVFNTLGIFEVNQASVPARASDKSLARLKNRFMSGPSAISAGSRTGQAAGPVRRRCRCCTEGRFRR